jgi:hypothetical protein
MIRNEPAVISYRPSPMPAFFSFLLTGAVFTGALLATFSHALAGDGDRGDAGGYYYDRYALPYVKRYAPPDTAPGTFNEPQHGNDAPRGNDTKD